MQRIKVGIIDDNELLIKALSQKLRLSGKTELVFSSSDAVHAIGELQHLATLPQVIFMDIEMPGMNGIEATARIRKLFPAIQIIMLTVFDDDEKVFQAVKAGATGYFLKDEPAERLEEGIAEVLSGGAPMSPGIALKALKMLAGSGSRAASPAAGITGALTEREMEVLKWISEGLKNKQIAEKMFLSPATVKKHIENIYTKIQVNSRVEMARLYKEL